MTDFTAKVNAGIALLNSRKPGWQSKINLDTLDLASCSVCVLGQIFGDYYDGIDELDVSGYDYGFNAMDGMQELTKAWKEALGKNNTLVEKGDVYKDSYGYAVKVLQTTLVKVDEETSMSVYLAQTGRMKNGSFVGDLSAGKPTVAMYKKADFEKGGSYGIKVEKFKPVPGMFITTASGKNYFVHDTNEVRELKDGAYAVSIDRVDLTGAKEMLTGMGLTFASSIKRCI